VSPGSPGPLASAGYRSGWKRLQPSGIRGSADADDAGGWSLWLL